MFSPVSPSAPIALKKPTVTFSPLLLPPRQQHQAELCLPNKDMSGDGNGKDQTVLKCTVGGVGTFPWDIDKSTCFVTLWHFVSNFERAFCNVKSILVR